MTQHNEKGTRRDLVLYRLEVAKSDIKSAKILLDAGECRGANNRAYYGIYHAISAIHALDGNAYKRHKDALANFNKNYIKTEIFPRILGRKIAEAEEIRHARKRWDNRFCIIHEISMEIFEEQNALWVLEDTDIYKYRLIEL